MKTGTSRCQMKTCSRRCQMTICVISILAISTTGQAISSHDLCMWRGGENKKAFVLLAFSVRHLSLDMFSIGNQYVNNLCLFPFLSLTKVFEFVTSLCAGEIMPHYSVVYFPPVVQVLSKLFSPSQSSLHLNN